MTSSPALQKPRTWTKGRDRLPAAAALSLVLSVVHAFSANIPPTRDASISGDEPLYLLTTQSLLADGDFDDERQLDLPVALTILAG